MADACQGMPMDGYSTAGALLWQQTRSRITGPRIQQDTGMAKKKPKNVSRKKAPKAEQKLRGYYALGQKIRAACKKANPEGRPYSKGVIQGFAEKVDRSREYCDKARQFAEVYSKRDLENLCKLRNSKGNPLSTDHVRKLLRVEGGKLRRRLQVEAADNDWGSKRLAAEITKRIGKSSEKRRGPTRPKTRHDALAHIEKMSDGWLRWFDGLQEPGDEELGRQSATLEDLPKSVQQRLKRTISSIKKLLAEAEQSLNSERKKQGKRAKRKKPAKKQPKG